MELHGKGLRLQPAQQACFKIIGKYLVQHCETNVDLDGCKAF